MSGGFSFPPPPPPPPKPSNSPPNQYGQGHPNVPGQHNGHGRGTGRGGPRGRGSFSSRGSSFSQPSQQRGESNPSWQYGNSQANYSQLTPSHGQSNQTSYQSQHKNYHDNSHRSGFRDNASQPRTVTGHKRKLEALKPPNERPKKPGPPTAPAIPSFGAPFGPLSTAVPPNKASINPEHAGTPSGRRSLGLTPSMQASAEAEDDSDDNDYDEEAMYAELGNKLTFEHNGVVMSLQSQADLIAWKTERQKNWPTKARMVERDEERRRIGQERRRLLGITAPSEQPRKPRPKPPAINEAPGITSTTADKRARRLNELRQKVVDSEAKNREAKAEQSQNEANASATGIEVDSPEESLGGAAAGVENEAVLKTNLGAYIETDDESLEESSSETSSESSSDSSSESDSDDDAPEETTSKPPQGQVDFDARPQCKFFAARGFCRYGDGCNFKHESNNTAKTPIQRPRDQRPPRQTAAAGDPSSTARKGIFQRLKEQEQEEEDKMALRVIKYLGKAGFFSDSIAGNGE